MFQFLDLGWKFTKNDIQRFYIIVFDIVHVRRGYGPPYLYWKDSIPQKEIFVSNAFHY